GDGVTDHPAPAAAWPGCERVAVVGAAGAVVAGSALSIRSSRRRAAAIEDAISDLRLRRATAIPLSKGGPHDSGAVGLGGRGTPHDNPPLVHRAREPVQAGDPLDEQPVLPAQVEEGLAADELTRRLLRQQVLEAVQSLHDPRALAADDRGDA